MKKQLFLFTTLLIVCHVNAQTFNFQWAKKLGSAGFAEPFSSFVDSAGNVYTTGDFTGTDDFDPGAGVSNLTSSGGTADIYISKLDASGNFVWAKRIGGSSNNDFGRSIAVDDSGNVYTTGTFIGTVDFDPGTGVFNLVSSGGTSDDFISKLDASGNFVWAKRIGGSNPDAAFSIALDSSANVYITGAFTSTMDFDPGTGVYNLLPSAGNIYILKLNSAGNFVWAKQFGGDSNGANKIKISKYNGHIYLTGSFSDTGDFDPGTGVYTITGSSSANNFFVEELDASGNFVWANDMVASPSECIGDGLDVDSIGNVYVTGYFRSPTVVAGSITLTNPSSATSGTPNTFIVKLNSSGSYVWAKSFPATTQNVGNSIALDKYDNVYTTGQFAGLTDFNPGAGSFNMVPAGSLNTACYVQKMDSTGNFVWAFQMVGSSTSVTSWGCSIIVDDSDNIYTTGGLYGTADFDPGVSTFSLSSPPGNTFVQKLQEQSITTDINNSKIEKTITIYPNPFTDQTVVLLDKEYKNTSLRITDVVGKEVRTINFSGKQQTVEKGELNAGIYFISVLSGKEIIDTKKIIIQ